MNIHILTPFPDMVNVIVNESILGRAQSKELAEINIHNLFDFTDAPHNRIDDYPFGGGAGMIMKVEPVFRAYDQIVSTFDSEKPIRMVFPTPDGEILDQEKAESLSDCEQLIFLSGHYKGIDQRIRDEIVTDEISIGDYILTGGELPTMVILDSILRLIPGVLNNSESSDTDSFNHPLLDGPHYTRPEIYRGMETPKVLLSGHHKKIEDWVLEQRENITQNKRPDLWKKYKSELDKTE